MSGERILDVSRTPTLAFGHRSILWWATAGVMVTEGMVFAFAIATLFYLRGAEYRWPPGFPPPSLLFSTLNTVVLLLSLIPNEVVKKAAEKFELRRTRLWMLIGIAFAATFVVLRFFEFGALHVKWNSTAYGSIVWVLLGLHTTHLVTDLVDTVVLAVLLYVGPVEKKRFVDVSENSFYWYFVVLTWMPIYAVLYWLPRM